MTERTSPSHTPIAPEQLSPEALQGLLEEFASRDGTDYGSVERTLEEKVTRLRELLESGEATIVFDSESETITIVVSRDLDSA
jgi:uncharacterized protein YheU (UPF0270 family)